MSIPSDIATYLATQGYGAFANANIALNNIFLDSYQDLPASQIIIIASGMEGFEVVSGDSILEDTYIDIQVRNTSRAEARRIAEEIRKLLCYNCSVIGYYKILGTSPYMTYLGQDEGSIRYKFALFFVVSTTRSF